MAKQYIEGEALNLERKTVEVFVSKTGAYFLTEESAKKDSYTHTKCENHGEIHGVRGFCGQCWEEKQEQKRSKLVPIEWDGECGIYSHAFDMWFDSLSDAKEYSNDEGLKLSEMKLSPSKPNHLQQVDTDFWEDVWYDGAELPSEIQDALDELNKKIREHGQCFSWEAVDNPLKL